MTDLLRSILASTIGLGIAAGIAMLLTVSRSAADAPAPVLRRFGNRVGFVILLQALHFGEELSTGFYTRFPELLGQVAWPVGFFVSFNLFWIAVWCLSALFLPAHPRATLFPLWFLGIACAANGVIHPGFALASGGYFPGLFTSPLVGLAGVWLLRGLTRLSPARSEQP